MADEHDDLLLPEGARLLHIGPQKTGTTAIQTAMHESRDLLRAHGVVYPGKDTRPREGVWAALGLPAPSLRREPRIGPWQDLVGEVEDSGGLRVCVSTEDFAKADAAGAARVVRELGGDRAHVVAAARRLDRLFPSQWQQRVKMGATLTYGEWLEKVLGDNPEDPLWQNIWVPHDVEALVDRWTKVVGPERFTLVVSDDSDRLLLSRTFERMLGLPAGILEGDTSRRYNESLGIGRVELIRHLNRAFDEKEWPPEVADGRLQNQLMRRLKVLAPGDDEHPIPPMPAWAAERVVELSDRRADAVRRLGVRVVGDPDGLRVPPKTQLVGEYDRPTHVSAELAAAAVIEALDKAFEARGELGEAQAREIERLRARLKRARRGARTAPRPHSPEDRPARDLPARRLLTILVRRGVRRLSARRRR